MEKEELWEKEIEKNKPVNDIIEGVFRRLDKSFPVVTFHHHHYRRERHLKLFLKREIIKIIRKAKKL